MTPGLARLIELLAREVADELAREADVATDQAHDHDRSEAEAAASPG